MERPFVRDGVIMKQATIEGYQAFQAFLDGRHDETQNPYPPVSLHGRNWFLGWQMACDDDMAQYRKLNPPQ